MKSYSIGYSAHNTEHELIKIELLSLIENNVKPDFIIFHQQRLKRFLIDLNNCLKTSKFEDHFKIKKLLKASKIYNIRDINSERAGIVLKHYKPGIVICNSGILSKKTIISNPDIIFLNKHCSQLPKYRGVNNVEWALWDKADIYGSIIRIHHGIDEGDILLMEKIDINLKNFDSIGKVREFCFKFICQRTGKAVSDFLNDKAELTLQSCIGDQFLQYYSMHPILRQKLENSLFL